MPKAISDKDRAIAYIKTASREEIDSLVDMAKLIKDVRFPSQQATTKRGRPAGSKPKPAPDKAAEVSSVSTG